MKDIMETTHSIKEFSEYDFQFHTKIIDYLENIQFSNVFAMFMYRMNVWQNFLFHIKDVWNRHTRNIWYFGLYEEWRYFTHL